MDGELISTAYTYNQGRVAINAAFSGTANLNAIALKTISTGSTYYIQPGDTFIVQTGGNLYLPAPNGEFRIIICKNYGAGTMDIIPDSGSIDGVGSGVTLSPLQAVTLQSDGGAEWYITNAYI